jgi:hypothetical protein
VTIRRTAIVLLSLALLFFGFVRFANWSYCGLFSYCPTDQPQSAFLRNYNPQHALAPLNPVPQNSSSGMSAGAGDKFVTNKRDFEFLIAIPPDKSALVMPALADDMAAQLTGDRAEILSRTGDPVSGFRLTYRIDQNLGSATLTPTSPDPRIAHYTHGGGRVPPPDGMQYVAAKIAISEEWYPKEATAIEASLESPR